MRWIALCNKPKNQLNINKITKDTYICTKVRWMDTKITNGIPPERKTCEWKHIVYLDRVLREKYKHTVVGHDWVRKMAAAALMLTCTLETWNGNFVFTKYQYYPKWKLCLLDPMQRVAEGIMFLNRPSASQSVIHSVSQSISQSVSQSVRQSCFSC